MSSVKITLPALALAAAALPGCFSLRTEKDGPALAVSGIVDG